MKTLSCEQARLLIDLFAAGECDPPDARAVRTHLSTCPACQTALEEAREMLGLLDVHFHEETALARLAQALRLEAKTQRKAPAIFLFVRPFAAAAALLLITFGLGVWLAPRFRPAPWPRPDLQATLVMVAPKWTPQIVHGVKEMAPKGAVGDNESARKVAVPSPRGKKALTEKKQTLVLKANDVHLRPQVRLDLVLRNPSPHPLEVQLGGGGFRLLLELSGGPVVRQTNLSPGFVPFPPRTVTIAPGRSVKLPVRWLASQVDGQVEFLYPMGPGEYTLRARLSTVAWYAGWSPTGAQSL